VGTGGDDPSEKMGPKYDTPTLLGVYRTAPYLHHGKAKTLRDVLTTCNKGDKHGKTSHLSPAQLDDLVAFLKSLPYEPPPDETPNTVKYRYRPRKE
jgi:cytochrome c peroxidase